MTVTDERWLPFFDFIKDQWNLPWITKDYIKNLLSMTLLSSTKDLSQTINIRFNVCFVDTFHRGLTEFSFVKTIF